MNGLTRAIGAAYADAAEDAATLLESEVIADAAFIEFVKNDREIGYMNQALQTLFPVDHTMLESWIVGNNLPNQDMRKKILRNVQENADMDRRYY